MKTVLLMVGLIALTSCKRRAQSSENIKDFQIEFLFEKDGCKVYRFYDGNYIYWSTCEGRTSYNYRTKSGKSASVEHQVQEVTVVK